MGVRLPLPAPLIPFLESYSYYYDGDGERVAKTTGATGTLYWRGPTGDPISESSIAGASQEEYIFFGSSRIARRDVTGSVVHYYFEDHLGSSAVVENATASSCEQDIDYYPYGGVVNDYCATVQQHYRFNGKERDTETGLDNFGARYDNSSLGRFMTPDWAAKPATVPYAKFGDPQTLNLYVYVENNPVNRIDADGHVEWAPSLNFNSGKPINIGVATALAAGSGGGMAGVPYSETIVTDSEQQAQQQAQNQAQQPSNRQPDGSYKSTPAQLAKIQEAADKKTTIGNGQCVTACERFTGVPGPTSLWEGGKPASELTDKDKGTAIATFVQGPDGKWRYLPDANGHMNSGTFMGTSTKGTFWMADQWPQGKPVSIWNVGSNPNNASMNAASYRVIVVPNP